MHGMQLLSLTTGRCYGSTQWSCAVQAAILLLIAIECSAFTSYTRVRLGRYSRSMEISSSTTLGYVDESETDSRQWASGVVEAVSSMSSSFSQDAATKVGILLLNLGGPETGDDVEGE